MQIGQQVIVLGARLAEYLFNFRTPAGKAILVVGIGGLLGIILGVIGTLIAGRLILQATILPDLPMAVGAFLFRCRSTFFPLTQCSKSGALLT